MDGGSAAGDGPTVTEGGGWRRWRPVFRYSRCMCFGCRDHSSIGSFTNDDEDTVYTASVSIVSLSICRCR